MRPPADDECARHDALLQARLGLALALVEAVDYDSNSTLRSLEALASRCAAVGVPAEAVHRMVDDGVLAAVADARSADQRPVTTVAGLLHRTVARAYLR
ncbi:hypothetical protein [Nocardia sp. XZ_19_385]|uniref:hypothetical protein n=1 Tax=Nocardia sp. XZ_19_385 TaxID=2769488 RepID=UPI00189095EB|nr:hypothetical protein [Nocardia sp. XZ_19_385]